MTALVLPALAAALVSLASGPVQRRMRPSLTAPLLAALAVAAAVAVWGGLSLLSLGYLAQVPWLAPFVGWCRDLYAHDATPAWVGMPATAGLAGMTLAAHRARRRAGCSLRPSRGGEVRIVPSDAPLAYAAAGDPGEIVVSTGMLRRLDSQERRVLFAHERAHLRRGHHRYLLLVDIAAAAVPILRPMRTQVRFATERWADEDAVAEVGDRHLVARAIARAALAPTEPVPAPLSLTGWGVSARVEALLDERAVVPGLPELSLAAGVVALTSSVASSTVQLHHLLVFVAHICSA